MDEIDIQILEALQANGRLKHNELARNLNLAQSTVAERVKRMESQRIIKGYRAVIDAAQMGLRGRHEKEIIHRFEEQIRGISHVQACYHLTGRYDYLLHVLVADLDGLGRLVKDVIAELPGLVTSETFVIFSEIKTDEGLPFRAAEPE
jgi:Lrp/AsnC family transcriptional regulator, leucine-responsive regulatory protein